MHFEYLQEYFKYIHYHVFKRCIEILVFMNNSVKYFSTYITYIYIKSCRIIIIICVK